MEATLPTPLVRQSNFVEKLVTSKLFWLLAVCFLFSYPIIRTVNRQMPPILQNYGKVPEFRFRDESGVSFGTRELKGKVYVANFMFTSCQTACPLLLKKVQVVQHRMRGLIDKAAIVSFTVDPETDSSSVLFSKARELKANPNVWRFLTAPIDQTKKLLVDGFKVPVGDKTFAESVMDVAHSNKLVLVDQKGDIRGYYSIEKEGINQMMIDVGLIINQKTI
ncbi:MAG TPA: SCO family protein [Bacteriovoracaceae bacterium]|nr:SCO family protein [Bacteriovoracaceae bacterium]